MTSNHDGVSCDLCRKNNFKGLRYKCLVCYDYDLCSTCYDAGLTSSRHTVEHPMQCIVARNDFELFYSGESLSSEHPQSLTCPFCGNLGYTEATLLEHVTNEHANSDNDESSAGIVCPICGVETNQFTSDFATHLTMEHRRPNEHMDQVAKRGRGARCNVRTAVPRGRRSQTHYNQIVSGGIGPTESSISSASIRDQSDPIVEILAQLSSVRRAGACGSSMNHGASPALGMGGNGASGVGGGSANSSNQSHASQLHQLQMRLQSSPSFSHRAAAAAAAASASSHPDHEVRIARRTFQSMNNNTNLSSSIGSLGGGGGAGGIGSPASVGISSLYSSSQPFMLMDQCSLSRASIVSSRSMGATGISGANATTTTTSGVGGVSGLVCGPSSIGGLTNAGMTSGQQSNCMAPNVDGSVSQPQFAAQYLLTSCMKPALSETEQQQREILKADRSLFVQDLLLQVGLLDKQS